MQIYKEEILENFKRLQTLHPELKEITIPFSGGCDDGWIDIERIEYSGASKIEDLSFFERADYWYNVLEWNISSGWKTAGAIDGNIVINENTVYIAAQIEKPVEVTYEVE